MKLQKLFSSSDRSHLGISEKPANAIIFVTLYKYK